MAVAVVIPSNRYKYSLGKQSAAGTAATNPDYQIPVYSADIGPEETRTELQLVEGQAFNPGDYKSAAWASGEAEWASEAASVGRLLAAHFGTSSDTVTGAGDPYTHTFTRKNVPLYHTLWVGRPKADGTFEYDKLVDCVVPTLEFRYQNGQLFRIGTTILGVSTVGVATAPSPTTTIVIPTAGVFGHTWVEPTLKLDLAATPGTTTIRNIQDFNVTLSYGNAEMMWTQGLNPDFYSAGLYSVGFSISMVLTDWTHYNHTFYGSASPSANTAQSSTAPSGSIDFTIAQEPASADRTLRIQVPYAQMSLGRPTPNADGSGIVATLTGKLSIPASGEPVTVIAKNAVSTSYS